MPLQSNFEKLKKTLEIFLGPLLLLNLSPDEKKPFFTPQSSIYLMIRTINNLTYSDSESSCWISTSEPLSLQKQQIA